MSNKILIDKKTVELALEVIQDYVDEYGPHEKDSGAAYTLMKLDQALEQSTEQEPESGDYALGYSIGFGEGHEAAKTSPPQPQEAAPRKPLTDEMITLGAKALAKRHADSCGLDFDDVWKYYADEHKVDARVALTAAHGITGEKE